MQTPCEEQLEGQAADSHAAPEKGASHAHVAVPACSSTTHGPRELHGGVPGQAGRSHAAPLQPARQRQRPLGPHCPCVVPLHSFSDSSLGQRLSVQLSPFQPSKHAQRPLGMHVPLAEHRLGQEGISQCGPDQPSSHTHWAIRGASSDERVCRPARMRAGRMARLPVAAAAAAAVAISVEHAPWPEQFETHRRIEQSEPPNPSKHEHLPSAPHVPRPEQSLGQSTPVQSSPLRPAAQTQMPLAHMPNGAWQSSGHCRSQKSPRAAATYPASQRHTPSMHAPLAPQEPPPSLLMLAVGLHARRSHFSPRQPGSQTHCPVPSQLPCSPQLLAEQSVGSGRCAAADAATMEEVASPQPSPMKPSAHAHTPGSPTQWPRPRCARQSSGQPRCTEQSSPCQPLPHSHVPSLRQRPWPLQSFRHALEAQRVPSHPTKHAHLPASQRP